MWITIYIYNICIYVPYIYTHIKLAQAMIDLGIWLKLLHKLKTRADLWTLSCEICLSIYEHCLSDPVSP